MWKASKYAVDTSMTKFRLGSIIIRLVKIASLVLARQPHSAPILQFLLYLTPRLLRTCSLFTLHQAQLWSPNEKCTRSCPIKAMLFLALLVPPLQDVATNCPVCLLDIHHHQEYLTIWAFSEEQWPIRRPKIGQDSILWTMSVELKINGATI